MPQPTSTPITDPDPRVPRTHAPLAARLKALEAPPPDLALLPQSGGTIPQWQAAGPFDLVIFDGDWTLWQPRAGSDGSRPTFPRDASDREWMPGRVDMLHRIQDRRPGVRFAIASNQGGPACGHGDRRTLEAALLTWWGGMRASADTCDLFVGLTVCYHHPILKARPETGLAGDCPWHKPSPGQLLAHIAANYTTPARTLFVGDLDSDRRAARAAMCRYMHPDQFFAARGEAPTEYREEV